MVRTEVALPTASGLLRACRGEECRQRNGSYRPRIQQSRMRQQSIRERVVLNIRKIIPPILKVVHPRLVHIPRIDTQLHRTDQDDLLPINSVLNGSGSTSTRSRKQQHED